MEEWRRGVEKEIFEMERKIGGLEGKNLELMKENIEEKERVEEMEKEREKERKVMEGMLERKDIELRKVGNELEKLKGREKDKKGISVDNDRSKILEIEREKGKCDDQKEKRIERWAQNQKQKERGIREREGSETALIMKRGAKALRRGDFERWLVERLKKDDVKIVIRRENKEAAEVFFKNKKERDEVRRRREELRESYDML